MLRHLPLHNPARRFIPALATTILAMAAAGCTQEECLENKNALPQAGFYDSAVPDTKIRLDSTAIYAVGAPAGTFVLDSLKSASTLTLPFNLDTDTTSFVFEYAGRALKEAAITDTLRLRYSRTPYFVSSACGVSYRLLIEDMRYSRHVIDSVSIPQALITNVEQQNIQIFFRVAHPEEEPGNPENPDTPHPDSSNNPDNSNTSDNSNNNPKGSGTNQL